MHAGSQSRPRPRLEMDQDLITDITLDHLPDLSDTSISFQIPSNDASADLLLTDNTNGFEVLCNAVDDDASFAPIPLRQLRGPPLMLGELTPRVQVASPSPRRPRSHTPTQVPSSSAKPSVIQRPLTLGHRSPDKPSRTPSRISTQSIRRHCENPLVSEERFRQLREEVGTLGQENESPAHVQVHVMDIAKPDTLECRSSPRADSKVIVDVHDIPPQSEDLMDLPEKRDMRLDVRLAAVEDVVMATGDGCHADTANVAVRAPMPKSRQIPRTSKPAAAAGGISKRTTLLSTHVSKKTKGKPPRVQEAHPVPPSAALQPTPPQSIVAEAELFPPTWKPGDLDLKSEKTQITHTGTGLAERLVSYSQKLISSIGLYKPSPENSSLEALEDAVRVADVHIETQPAAARPPSLSPQCINDIPDAHIEPLRLSEISPYKLPPEALRSSSPANTGGLQDGGRHATSPTRPAKKRVSMYEDQPLEYPRRKRRKTMTADAEPQRGSSYEAVSQRQPPAKKKHVHREQYVTQPETCDSTLHLESSKSTLPSPRTKYRPKLTSSRCRGPTLDALSGSRQLRERIKRVKGKRDEGQFNVARDRSVSSLSRTSASSHSQLGRRIRQENAMESSHTRQRSGPTSTVDLPLIEKKQNAATFVAEQTKPVGFTFRVDARLEMRKAEERLAASEPGKTQPLHPVPGVKAHRASHQAAFIIHKREGVVPSVPVAPFFFCTEQRAKEREKFDEMVKRKEEEMQKLKEEQRRREAEEEEMAIKELRRKAIPKANEVPEWYADMPKRKGTVV